MCIILYYGTFVICALSEKKYKSCYWGCSFSKGKLLSIFRC